MHQEVSCSSWIIAYIWWWAVTLLQLMDPDAKISTFSMIWMAVLNNLLSCHIKSSTQDFCEHGDDP
jgi:hypothetical protein